MTTNHRSNPNPNQLITPAALALQNWKNEVAKLDAWEQGEIEGIYQQLNKLLQIYESSAALAITRAALEIGLLQGR